MRRKSIFMCLALSLTAMFTSCTSERSIDEQFPKDESDASGKIVLDLSADARFIEQTRAVNEDDYRNTANYTVQLWNNDDPTKFIVNCKYSELNDNMPGSFKPGKYTAKAFYGNDVNCSRNEFYVEGFNDNINVAAGNPTKVTLPCTPTAGKLSVTFSSDMATYYNNYEVVFSQAAALAGSSVTWSATDTEPFYVKLNAAGETLRYTINLTAKDDYAYTDDQGNKKTNGTVTKEFTLQRNRAYHLTIKPDYTATTEGGLSIIIDIDEDTNDPIDIPVQVPIDWL